MWSIMASAAITLYPDSGGNASDFAEAGVNTLNNDFIPQLTTNTDINASLGTTVPEDINDSFENFKDWIIDSGRSNGGECHMYVIDSPLGQGSFTAGGISATSDAYSLWNAGRAHLKGGDDFNQNVFIHEACHSMMITSYCPGDDQSNNDQHTCGSVYASYFPEKVTPMITGYSADTGGEYAGAACNGVNEGHSDESFVPDLSDCTQESVSDYLNINF